MTWALLVSTWLASGTVLINAQPLPSGLKVAAWGSSQYGQADIPESASNVIAIAAGNLHGLALREDGTLVAWGGNGNRQTDVPRDLTNVVAVAAGVSHSMALRADGTVAAWGRFLSPLNWEYVYAYVPPGLTNVIAINAGDYGCQALQRNGRVIAWGIEGAAELATSNVLAMDTSTSGYTLLVLADGTVQGFGSAHRWWKAPRIPRDLTNVVAVAAGGLHCLALTSAGKVRVWLPYDLDAGMNPIPLTNVPPNLAPVRAIAAGYSHSLALQTNGSVVAWGYTNTAATAVPPNLRQVSAVAARADYGLALAPNVPPVVTPRTWLGGAHEDYVLRLPAADVNHDPLTFRIASLPEAGTVYQYTPSGRGEPITATNVTLNDVVGRFIFAPDAVGTPAAQIGVIASDGADPSVPALAAVHYLAPPRLDVAAVVEDAQGAAFHVAFDGFPSKSYSVFASTNLVDWTRLGTATESAPGRFAFSDVWRVPDGMGGWLAYWTGPSRFYQVGFFQQVQTP